MNLRVLPECFGTHEDGHPDCDGDPDADDAILQKPCAVREACTATKEGRLPPDSGEPTEPAEPTRGLLDVEPTRQRRKRTLPPRTKVNARAQAVFEHFKARIVDETGMRWATPGQAPVPGELFLIHHVGTAGYISVNARTDGGVVALARVFFYVREEKKIVVGFPTTIEEARAAMVAGAIRGLRLKATPLAPGLFKCRTDFVDKGPAGTAARLAAKINERRK